MNLGAEALALQDVLDQRGSRSIVVPVSVGGKQPMFAHRGGVWTRQDSVRYFTASGANRRFSIGILLRDEFVLDFDDRVIYGKLCKEFKELMDAPAERSTRGMHVFFARSPAVDAANLTDCPLKDPRTREILKVDFKSHTRSVVNGHVTRALIVVSPSDGRQWVEGRSLTEKPLKPPTDKLVKWLSERARVKAPKKGVEKAPSSITQGSEPPLQYTISAVAARFGDEITCRPIEASDKSDVFGMLELGDASCRPTKWQNGAFSGMSFKAKGACPCCNRHRPHNNQYYTSHGPDGVRRLRNHGCNGNVVVPYSRGSTAAYQRRWREAADTAFRALPLASAIHLGKSVGSLEKLVAVGAWWDGESKVYYSEFSASDGTLKFVAVGLDAMPGTVWIETPDVSTMRICERPHCFGDLQSPFGAAKGYMDGESLKTLAGLIQTEIACPAASQPMQGGGEVCLGESGADL